MSSGARAASVSAISLALLAALCLSLACLSAGKGSSLWARHARRGFDFRAGWLAFSSNRNGFAARPLREIAYGTAIAGAVSASTLALSCVLAAVCLTLCLLGKAGGFLAAVAVPAAVLVAAPLCVFQVLMSVYGSKTIQREIGLRWVPWPDIGWCLGIAAALLWALVGCLGCCVPARRKKRKAAFASSSAPVTPLAAAAAGAGAATAVAPSPSAPPPPPLAHAPSSGDNNKKSTATPFTEGMDSEDAEALGASTSRPGSAAVAGSSGSGFAKVPSFKLPKFAATKAKEGGGGASSGGGSGSNKRSSSSRGGGASSSGAAAAGSSSVPVAPASAFGGAASNENESDSPRVSVAQPAVLPQAPAPEALPNPQRLGFFAAVKRSMSRVASSTTTSAEREVGGAAAV